MSSEAQLEAPVTTEEADPRLILEGLFDEYSGSILAYFRRQGFSEERARDLCQETFLRAWKGLDSFRAESRGSTWLFKIARNLLLNTWRDSNARKRDGLSIPLDGEDGIDPATPAGTLKGPEEVVLDSEVKDLLHHELQALPDQMRQCLQLRLRDLKYREIADILGVSIETVKSHLYQARQRLKQSLEPYFDLDIEDESAPQS